MVLPLKVSQILNDRRNFENGINAIPLRDIEMMLNDRRINKLRFELSIKSLSMLKTGVMVDGRESISLYNTKGCKANKNKENVKNITKKLADVGINSIPKEDENLKMLTDELLKVNVSTEDEEELSELEEVSDSSECSGSDDEELDYCSDINDD